MTEPVRELREDEGMRFLYEGSQDGIVYCKVKDYLKGLEKERGSVSCQSIDDSGGRITDRHYISATYHLGDEGSVEVLLLSNEHLLVISNPPDLDMGYLKTAVPELREYGPDGCESREDVQRRLEDRCLGEKFSP